MGRTARGKEGRGRALLLLMPEELGFLKYLKQAKVCVCGWVGGGKVYITAPGREGIKQAAGSQYCSGESYQALVKGWDKVWIMAQCIFV